MTEQDSVLVVQSNGSDARHFLLLFPHIFPMTGDHANTLDPSSVLLSKRVKIFAIPINDPNWKQAFIIGADTASFGLRLLNALSKDQGKRWSVKDWANRNGLVAAINASMYQKDMMSSV